MTSQDVNPVQDRAEKRLLRVACDEACGCRQAPAVPLRELLGALVSWLGLGFSGLYLLAVLARFAWTVIFG